MSKPEKPKPVINVVSEVPYQLDRYVHSLYLRREVRDLAWAIWKDARAEGTLENQYRTAARVAPKLGGLHREALAALDKMRAFEERQKSWDEGV